MSVYELLILAVGYILWFLPFPLNRWRSASAARIDRRARWGMLLQVAGYTVLWQGHFWLLHPAAWRVTLSMLFLALGTALSWSGTRALGRHLRFDAGLDADHKLIRSGPYRVVRHPIYASMLCVFLGTAAMIGSLTLTAIGLVLFVAGTEIRVRVEDKLLAGRFAQEFASYRQSISAYVPYVR